MTNFATLFGFVMLEWQLFHPRFKI